MEQFLGGLQVLLQWQNFLIIAWNWQFITSSTQVFR